MEILDFVMALVFVQGAVHSHTTSATVFINYYE